jgi:NAD(P)-dependent dehydrogenase (short-subunit alcohol dehydrogenase family)
LPTGFSKIGGSMGRVQDKVALITGGASGIGLATAKLLVEEGATVVVADRDVAASTAAVAALGQRACFHRLDVTREDEWIAVTDAVVRDFGRIDILVNNAGMDRGHRCGGARFRPHRHSRQQCRRCAV